MQQGSKANKTGKELESFTNDILKCNNYEFVKSDEFCKFVRSDKFRDSTRLGKPIYTGQFHAGLNIYNKKMSNDFVLYHPNKHNYCLIIECKWQQVGGSVEEKYPYLVLNIKDKYPYKTIILLDGEGYSEGAKNWLTLQVGGKLIEVMSMQEFQTYCNNDNI